MPEPPSRIYMDACGFLAYINEEPCRVDTISDLLESGKDNIIQIYTSELSKSEVAYSHVEREQQALDEATEAKIDALWDGDVVTVVEVHAGISNIARTLMRQSMMKGWGIRTNDAIHLATAQWLTENGATIDEFHTYDESLDKYAVSVSFKICRPYVANPRLM